MVTYSDNLNDRPIPGRGRRAAVTTLSIVLMIVASIVFAILAISPLQDRQTHQSILTSLRSLDLNNASLQRDVLRARAALLYNYDPLVDSVVGLHRDVSTLRGLFEEPETAKDESVVSLLDDIQQSIDHDEAEVESFKTQNALLQNSLRIFVRSLRDLDDNLLPRHDAAADAVSGLGNLMLQYTLKYDDQTANTILRDLDVLDTTGSVDNAPARLVTMHGRLILSVLPQVRKIIMELQSSDTINRAQRLQHRYLEIYGRANTNSQLIRMFLGTVSVLLCFYVVILVHRLRTQTDRLSRRLNFEGLVKEIKASFERGHALEQPLATSVDAALDLVRIFFDASRCRLSIIERCDMMIKESFGDRQIEILDEADLIADLLADGKAVCYRDLQTLASPYFSADGGFGGRVLALTLSEDLAAICIVEFSLPKLRGGTDEAVLLESAVRSVMQTLNYYREQQERQTLEQRLEHAERLQAVGTLAGGIAHEFNNILVAILGYGEMVLQLLRRRSTTRHYVEEIVKAAERSRLIIDQILALSRKRERVNKPIDLVEVVRDLEALLRVSLPAKVELVTDYQSGRSVIDGNPIDVQQILMNLCKNAAEAMDGSGAIRVDVKTAQVLGRKIISHGILPPRTYVILSVRDSGKGISAAVLPNIFEPFFTTRAKSGGTGLGLAAVHGNVTALGGNVDVSSRPGHGTVFDIYIPHSPHAPVPLRQFFNEERVPLGAGEAIIVFEQDDSARAAYEDQLAAFGYEPIGVKDWEQLKARLSAADHGIDLVLIDASSFPSGITATQIDIVLGKTSRLFISDYPEAMPADIRSAFQSHVLRKPVAAKVLASAISAQTRRLVEHDPS